MNPYPNASPPTPPSPNPMDRAAVLDRMRQAQDRSFDCEGIPMFLALVAAGPSSIPAATQAGPLAEGAALADELDAVRTVLFPTRRDDDQGCLVTTVQSLTVGTFDRGRPA